MDIIPDYRMGDGAQEITNAGLEIFGDVGTRLMCWPHTFRNLVPRLSHLRRLNKNLADAVLEDIESKTTSCSCLKKEKKLMQS